MQTAHLIDPSQGTDMIIKPTIGRKLWYWPEPDDRRIMACIDGQPLDATVVYVHNDSMVTLTINDHHGFSHPKTAVHLYHGDTNRPTLGRFCEWMPFQVGQAARDTPASDPPPRWEAQSIDRESVGDVSEMFSPR